VSVKATPPIVDALELDMLIVRVEVPFTTMLVGLNVLDAAGLAMKFAVTITV
jgi:hypothetical protein